MSELLPAGHQRDIEQREAKRQRQNACSLLVDGILDGKPMPYDRSVLEALRSALPTFSKDVVKGSLQRHTNRLDYLHLIIDSEFWFDLDGNQFPIMEESKAQVQIRIDNWAQVWDRKAEAEIQRRIKRDNNYAEFLAARKAKADRAKKQERQSARVSKVKKSMSPVGKYGGSILSLKRCHP